MVETNSTHILNLQAFLLELVTELHDTLGFLYLPFTAKLFCLKATEVGDAICTRYKIGDTQKI